MTCPLWHEDDRSGEWRWPLGRNVARKKPSLFKCSTCLTGKRGGWRYEPDVWKQELFQFASTLIAQNRKRVNNPSLGELHTRLAANWLPEGPFEGLRKRSNAIAGRWDNVAHLLYLLFYTTEWVISELGARSVRPKRGTVTGHNPVTGGDEGKDGRAYICLEQRP